MILLFKYRGRSESPNTQFSLVFNTAYIFYSRSPSVCVSGCLVNTGCPVVALVLVRPKTVLDLRGQLAGFADLLAMFPQSRPHLRAHSWGLAKWALASASPGQEGDEDSRGGASFVPGTLHSFEGSQEADPMASFFLCKLILIEREIIPFQKLKFWVPWNKLLDMVPE